jgi:hypothetical protein
MKYLYYSVYIFYTKVVKIESWGESPVFYCSGLISVFESMLIFSILDFYLVKSNTITEINYSKWIPISFTIVLFLINYFYFRKRNDKLIKEINDKSRKSIFFMKLVSSIIIIFIIVLFFYTGDLARVYNGY